MTAASGPVSGTVLEAEARRRHAEGDYPATLAGYEAAFARYEAEGHLVAAARAARTVAWLRGWVFGDWAVYEGWSARSQALLERADDQRAEGWLRYGSARRGSALDVQRQQYMDAISLARRARDVNLECEATASLGIMLVFSGFVDEGMAHLDHALAAICGGAVDELPVLEGCLCGLFNACERTNDIHRAEQWLRAADGVIRRQNLTTAAGFCRGHYAGILISAGRWDEAERELASVLDALDEGTEARTSALCRLADLRVRQGRLDEAAVLLDGLGDHEDATSTLAGLHLQQGNAELALEVVDRRLSRGGLPDYTVAPLLALKVGCHLALGELPAAAASCRRIVTLASAQRSPVLHALAAATQARVCAARSDGDPRACWHEAMSHYSEAHMPVEVARCRLELARVLAAARPAAALAEATSALAALEGRGATRDADAAAELVRRLGGPSRTGPKRTAQLTRREEQVLLLLGCGLANRAIADRLYISPKTVEHHVSHILAKLGLRSRAEAAAYAARRNSPPARC